MARSPIMQIGFDEIMQPSGAGTIERAGNQRSVKQNTLKSEGFHTEGKPPMTIRNVFSIVCALAAIQFLHLEDAYSQSSPLSAKELIEHASLKAHVEALKDGDLDEIALINNKAESLSAEEREGAAAVAAMSGPTMR